MLESVALCEIFRKKPQWKCGFIVMDKLSWFWCNGSHLQVLFRTTIRKKLANFTEKQLWWRFSWSNVEGLTMHLCLKTLNRGCLPVNFAKFCLTVFLFQKTFLFKENKANINKHYPPLLTIFCHINFLSQINLSLAWTSLQTQQICIISHFLIS